MWSLVKFVAIQMCIEQLGRQSVVGQGTCKFVYDDGMEVEIPEFGVKLPTIKDITEPGEILFSVNAIDVESIISVTSDSINNYHYIAAVVEKKRLNLTLTDVFKDFEKNEDLPSTSINVEFQCSSGSRAIEFIQPIEDTNNNDPEFEKKSYVYTLPMPFPMNVALTNFTSIAARDIDLTNTNITFNLNYTDPNVSGFAVSWSSSDRKLHYATLLTKTVINFLEDVTFRLSATDTGIPSRTSETKVTIQVDRGNSILRFAQPLYTADLTDLKPQDANGKIITFVEGDVGLARGIDKDVEYTIHDDLTDYTENFRLTTTDDCSTVQVHLVDPPEKFFWESFVLLSVTATKPSTIERTVLHLSLPGLESIPTTSEPSEECECSNVSGASGCESIGYTVAIIVLVILLVAATAGLIVTVIINHRIRRKSVNEGLRNNNEQRVIPEMQEVRNGSVSSSGSFRKSVAFDDNVEEIKIVRL